MAINNKINDLIKQFLYIIYTETYQNKTNSTFIERYVAKHPLLKPELIVINDQIQGFKKVSKKVMSLEEFPIYLEIEGMYENENIYLIDAIDLYSETILNCQSRLTDIIYIANVFSHYISFERSIDVSNPKEESIIITSKIQEYLIIKSEAENINKLTSELDYDDIEKTENKDLVINIARKVQKENNTKIDFLVGTMIELPRAAIKADDIAKHAEFFSFGTNDLTQTTFGISRDDSGKFLNDYIDNKIFTIDPFISIDDGVKDLVEIAVAKGKKKNQKIKLGICGEHGGDPKSIKFCSEAGLNYVSCSPYRVPIARLAAAQAELTKNKD